MSTVNSIHTPCKNCVFAQYEHKTQIGCHLDYINKYRSKNIEVLEAYDNDKEFYIINDKKCIGYRENSWFEKRNLSNLSLEEKIQRFKDNNYLHYLLIINLSKFNNTESLNQLSQQIKALNIKPRKTILIRYQNNKNHPLPLIQNLINSSDLVCEWRIQTMLEDKDYDSILYEAINLNKKHRFILSINGLPENLENIVNRANTIVYEDMDRFLVVRDKTKNTVLFSAPNYRYALLTENKDILITEDNHIII